MPFYFEGNREKEIAMNGKRLKEAWMNGEQIYPLIKRADIELLFNGNIQDTSGNGSSIDFTINGPPVFVEGIDGRMCVESNNKCYFQINRERVYDPNKLVMSVIIYPNSDSSDIIPSIGCDTYPTVTYINTRTVSNTLYIEIGYVNIVNTYMISAPKGKFFHLLIYIDTTQSMEEVYVNGVLKNKLAGGVGTELDPPGTRFSIFSVRSSEQTVVAPSGVRVQDFMVWKGDNIPSKLIALGDLWNNKYKPIIEAQ